MRIPKKHTRVKGNLAHLKTPQKATPKEVAKNRSTHEDAVAPATVGFWGEIFNPLARMLGHMFGTSLSFVLFCAGEMLMHKVYTYLLSFAAVEQLALFKFGETAIFYAGFLWWFISMVRGTAHAVKAELKNIPH